MAASLTDRLKSLENHLGVSWDKVNGTHVGRDQVNESAEDDDNDDDK